MWVLIFAVALSVTLLRRVSLVSLLLAPTVAIAVGYSLYLADLEKALAADNPWLAVASLLYLIVAIYLSLQKRPIGLSGLRMVDPLSKGALLIIAAAIYAAVHSLFDGSFVLPSQDPVSVPTYVQLMRLSGGLLRSFEPFSTQPAYYPPGFSYLIYILTSHIYDSIAILRVFREIYIAALALVPLAWAYLCIQMFPQLRAQRLAIVSAFYIGFVFFDRTLLLSSPLSGKNALILAGAILPLVISEIFKARNCREMSYCVLVTLGVTLIHYSCMHLLAICCLVFAFSRHGLKVWRDWRVAVIGVVVGGLFAPYLLLFHEAGEKLVPLTGSLQGRFQTMYDALFGVRSNFLFIFNDIPWPEFIWDYKGHILFGGATCVLTVAMLCRHRILAAMIFVFAAGTLLSAALASGLIPHSGVNFDYSRWIAFYLIASLASAVIFVGTQILLPLHRYLPSLVLCGTLFGLSYQSATNWSDISTFKRLNARSPVSKSSLRIIRHTIESLPLKPDQTCGLVIASSNIAADTYDYPLAWRYVSALTHRCPVVNGHNAYKAWAGGRDWRGRFPSASFIEAAQQADRKIFIISGPEVLESYHQEISQLSFEPTGLAAEGLTIWGVRASGG